MAELSVIIPARNEEFLNRTVDEVLDNSSDKTECIVILDGQWPIEPLLQHDRLKVIYHPVSRGQRASINDGVHISTAKYIMKLDAHCTLAKGFDEVLIKSAEELGRKTTQVPLQYNLHGFDWVCPDGHRRYQSPSGPCLECLKPTTKEIIWKKRESRRTWAWRFDKELHFQYWREYEKEHREDYVETMSLLGACWFLDREWYWELGGSDEAHGSWGQQGTEIACKTWLSGGRLICNRKTWFSHLFRTQGGDFDHPFPVTNGDVQKARDYSKDIWLNNRWDKAIYPLSWLIEKFNPPDW